MKFAKKIGDIAAGALFSALYGKYFGRCAKVFFKQINELKKSDPYSKGVSYKTYSAKAVSPKDNRYCKVKTVTYSRVNYKGKSKTGYLYGTMM